MFKCLEDEFRVAYLAFSELMKIEDMPRGADVQIGQKLKIMMLRVLRRFLQDERLPVWDADTNRVKCKANFAGVRLYDVLPALLYKWITQINTINADEDEDEKLTPQSPEYSILAELVLCIGAAAENMAFCLPPNADGICEPAELAKNELLKLFVLQPHILNILNLPNIPLPLVKAVLSTLSILMGYSQNYEAANGGFVGQFAIVSLLVFRIIHISLSIPIPIQSDPLSSPPAQEEKWATELTRMLTLTVELFIKVSEITLL